MANRELWVAGFPGYCGGANTELDHNIDLWRRFGVDVHLVPMGDRDPVAEQSVLARGCRIHEYCDNIFAGKMVVSFCNDIFLKKLPLIMQHGRPAKVIWFNCMTWLFEPEKEAHAKGWIDLFGYISDYQQKMLVPQLEAIRPVNAFRCTPYFNAERIERRYREWDGSYRMGRISRDDQAKYPADMWRIFDRVLLPPGLKKKVYVLGYGPNALVKTGKAPVDGSFDLLVWNSNAIPAAQFYNGIDTMIHKTGGSRESYSRVLLEAYAHGVVPIVERDFAFPELVVHGETGYMASSSDEMSFIASMLAHDPAEHRRVAENGRKHLEQLINPEKCWAGWKQVLQ
jgi:glycosyltransferase involved in cell wall biosynthesis